MNVRQLVVDLDVVAKALAQMFADQPLPTIDAGNPLDRLSQWKENRKDNPSEFRPLDHCYIQLELEAVKLASAYKLDPLKMAIVLTMSVCGYYVELKKT